MSIPNNFNEWENLQDLIRKDHNKIVKAYFKNQPDNDITTPKSRLKHTCIIKDEDTAAMTQLRMWLFEITIGHAQSLQAPLSGIPTQELQRNIKYKPQVKLNFKEPFDSEIHRNGVNQVRGEITFRLINETSETISRAKAEVLARAIKNEFAKPLFIWEKGWFKCTYLDNDKGYDLRLFVKSRAEGERVIKQVLKIQNHSFDKDFFQYIEHDKTFPVNPGTHRVYVSNTKKYRKRPRADLRFSYAQLLVHGRLKPINLVAVGNRLRSVIEKM